MNTISDANTASASTSMMKFYGDNRSVARFAAGILLSSDIGYQSITITIQGKSEDCSVLIVTDTSSADIVEMLAHSYSLQPISIFHEITPGG